MQKKVILEYPTYSYQYIDSFILHITKGTLAECEGQKKCSLHCVKWRYFGGRKYEHKYGRVGYNKYCERKIYDSQRFKIYFPVKDVSRSKETTIVEMNTKR